MVADQRFDSTTAVWPVVGSIAFAVAIVLFMLNFDIGFRTTADQIHFTEFVATHSLPEIVDNIGGIAKAQGRLGHLIVFPLLYAGAFYGDFFLYPLLCVGVLLGIAWALFRWAELLAGARVAALPLMALFLALLPVGLHHWLPNAYPMQFLPLALALGAKVVWLRGHPRFRSSTIVLALLVLLGAASYELAFTLLIGMAAAELMAWRFAARDSGVNLTRNYLGWQVAILAVAGLLYLTLRLAFPSNYEGNRLPEVLDLSGAAMTTGLHIYHGLSLDLIVSRLGGLRPTFAEVAVAAFIGAAFGLATWRLRMARRTAWLLVLAGLMIALLVTLPIGIVTKYIDWCRAGECTYIDSRFALMGVTLAVTGLLVVAFGNRAARPILSVAVVALAATTYLVNADERARIDFGKRAEDEAKRYLCLAGSSAADELSTAEGLARLPVSFHPEYDFADKVQYWRTYLAHLRANQIWLCP